MKHAARLTGIILLVVLMTGSADSYRSTEDHCRKERFSTAEPGTCFHPDAYRVLMAIKKARENPTVFDSDFKFIKVFEPRVHCVKDTLVRTDSLSVALRLYYPDKKCKTEAYPLIFFIHGGAFMYGDLEAYDMLCKKIARMTSCIVCSVDYRLAPEHPYPAAVNDCCCALKWVSENCTGLGGKEDAFFLMGSSAGANLATVMCIKNADDLTISGQILYYPPTTFRDREFPSRMIFLKDTTREYFLTEDLFRRCKESYMADYDNDSDPCLSPLEAKLHSELPPALIFTAQCDPLRDEGKAYADSLSKAGVPTQYIQYEGMIHGFLSFYMVLKDGKRSLRVARDFIRNNTTPS